MPPGKMMRIGIGKCLESDEPHEFVDFVSFFAQHSARDETGLDVAANSQPRKQIWILKNETTFRARLVDWVRANQKFARVGRIETGNETKQGGLAAAARADERNQFSRRRVDNEISSQSLPARERIVGHRKAFADLANAERGRFGLGQCYHLMIPFCQTSTRSRTLNSKRHYG